MDTIITVLFGITMIAVIFAVVAHLVVQVGLVSRRVPFSHLWSWVPGYLRRLCERLPPSQENVRLARIAKWSDIFFVAALAMGAIAGPLMSQLR